MEHQLTYHFDKELQYAKHEDKNNNRQIRYMGCIPMKLELLNKVVRINDDTSEQLSIATISPNTPPYKCQSVHSHIIYSVLTHADFKIGVTIIMSCVLYF